jgi:HAD superfamily phosphatase (TIGR01668 family)
MVPALVWKRGERGEQAVEESGDSVERFRADHHVETLPEVALDRLAQAGIRGIIVDLDNTVCAYHRPELAPGVAEWVAAARARGFALVLVSNNFSERVASVGARLGIPVVPNALKPLPFAFLRALKLLGTPRHATVVIGDQLFTDVLGAKLLGLQTILTDPLVEVDFPLTRVLRFLERTLAGRM